MKIISTNKKLPFDFKAWDTAYIDHLYAGMNVVMAVTPDGRVLHTGHNCALSYTNT